MSVGARELDALLGRARVAVLLVAEGGGVVAANAAALRLLGGRAAEWIGVDLGAHVTDRRALGEHLRLAARTRDPVPGRMIVTRKDGARLDLRSDAFFVGRDARGSKLVLVELHERDQAIRQFLLLETQLAELRAEIARRKRVEAELQAALHVREDFLAIASHELNTPLTSLQLRVSALLRHPEDAAEIAPHLAQQVERLTALAAELLDVSRISSGGIELHREPDCDLGQIASEVAARFAPELARCGSTLELLAPERVTGTWDRARVDQVVTNLVSNAIKYGEGKPIHVHVDRVGDRARLVVRDHGIGLEPEAKTRVFERFERAASAECYSGLGLGLWIARRVVEAHGGTIAIESAPMQGAELTVVLPGAAPLG